MAKIINGKDLRCKQRQSLPELIPLPGPFLVYLEQTNLCNLKCSFCPTSDKNLLRKIGRPSGVMSLELFHKIINDMAEFDNPIKMIHFYKDGEPLLHQNLIEMLTYLKQSGVAEKVRLKTNGLLLCAEMNRKLINTGIDWIGISVEAVSTAGYRKISGVSIDYEKFVDNIRDLFHCRGTCEIYVKIINANLSEEDKEKFYLDFKAISDFCAIEELMGLSYTKSKDFLLGTKPETQDGLPLIEKDVCPYPFYSLAINFNGAVSICCVDWSHSTVVGDVNKNSLKEIWNGPQMFEFRRMHLEHRRGENKACADCYFIKQAPDNLDGQEAIVMERLSRKRT